MLYLFRLRPKSSSTGVCESGHPVFRPGHHCEHGVWVWTAVCRPRVPGYQMWRCQSSGCWRTREHEPGGGTPLIRSEERERDTLIGTLFCSMSGSTLHSYEEWSQIWRCYPHRLDDEGWSHRCLPRLSHGDHCREHRPTEVYLSRGSRPVCCIVTE